uniref:G-protein coupled receptors family 1 profile domain-containing protein n=1 Tax=Knipowitschia caucasica TaxID=637954 RepID=A0AAV2ML56_KNICA
MDLEVQIDQFNSSALTNSTECPSIDDFRNQVYSTVYSLITVFAFLANGLALIILTRTYQKSSPFHIYMLNLAVSDILCVCTLPLRISYYVNKGQWNYGDFLCRFSSYSLYVNLYCSIYFMAVMSVTRFLAIVFPVKNISWVTVKRCRLVCFAVWVLICLLSIPFLMSGEKFDSLTNKTKCFEPPIKVKNIASLVRLNYLSLAVGFLLPFLAILICYVVCFTPYHVQRTIHLHFLARTNASCEEKVAMQKYVVVTLCLAASNSCFDPMLYFFSGEGFKSRITSFKQSFKSKRHKEQQSTDQKEQQSTDQKEQQSTDQEEIQSTDQEEQQSTDQKEQQSTDQKEQQFTDQEEIQSTDQKEQQSTDQKEQQSTDQKEQQSTDQEEQQSTDQKEQQFTDQKEQQSTDLSNCPTIHTKVASLFILYRS